MRTAFLAFFLLLPCATSSFAQFRVVALAGNVAGSRLCDPVTCVPDQVQAPAGSTVLLWSRGATFQPHLHLFSAGTMPCVPIPGLAGNLIVQAPVTVVPLRVSFARIYVHGGSICTAYIGQTSFALPPGLPSGSQFALQVVAPAPALVFSNATQFTIQ